MPLACLQEISEKHYSLKTGVGMVEKAWRCLICLYVEGLFESCYLWQN